MNRDSKSKVTYFAIRSKKKEKNLLGLTTNLKYKKDKK